MSERDGLERTGCALALRRARRWPSAPGPRSSWLKDLYVLTLPQE